MFVIVYKELPKIEEKDMEKYPFLSGLMSFFLNEINGTNGYRDDKTILINNTDDLLNHCLTWDIPCFYHNYQSFSEKEKIFFQKAFVIQKKNYKKKKTLLEKGYKILLKKVGYDNCCLRNLLMSFPEGENENLFIYEEEEA